MRCVPQAFLQKKNERKEQEEEQEYSLVLTTR